MDAIEAMLDALVEREGGYVNHSADRGGATNFGITEAVARAEGYAGPMQALSRTAAKDIYRRRYWTAPGFAMVAPVAPKIAVELLDTGVNMGPEVATAFLQRALNALNREARDWSDVAVDRRLGPATLAALRALIDRRGTRGEAVLLKAMNALQGERYLTLAEARPANEAFVFGWLENRIG